MKRGLFHGFEGQLYFAMWRLSLTIKVSDKPTVLRNHLGPLPFLNDYQEAL